MTYKLKSHRLQIPNGFKFVQPETGWQAPRFISFEKLVDALMAHRAGNPHLAQKHGWAMDRPAVYAEVERYNVQLCVQNGWKEYLTNAGESPPKSSAHSPLLFPLGRVAVGAETLVDWLTSGAEAVEPGLSERRAIKCVECPLNQRGDLTSFFTVPVANAIRAVFNLRNQWKLKTQQDDKLGVCAACSCPLKLMVHVPLAIKLAKMPAESQSQLWEHCWVRSEQTS